MAEHIITYWWMSPGPVKTGTDSVWGSDRNDAVDRFMLDRSIAALGGQAGANAYKDRYSEDYSVEILSVVTPTGDRDKPFEIEGPFTSQGNSELKETYSGDVAGWNYFHAEQIADHQGEPKGHTAYVVTGLVGGDDTRFVQEVMSTDVVEAIRRVHLFLTVDFPGAEITPDEVEVWSVIEAAKTRTITYIPDGSPQPPSTLPSPSRMDQWVLGKYHELKAGKRPTGGFDPADVSLVNRYRKTLGMADIDLAAGWTPKEVADMAESVRKRGRLPNPSSRLKRKLVR